jgi:hypothetical protein
MMPRPDDTEFDWSEAAPGGQTEARITEAPVFTYAHVGR